MITKKRLSTSRRFVNGVITLCLVGTLIACSEKPPRTTPIVQLAPPLERPVLPLNTNNINARGNILIPQAAVVERGGLSGTFVLSGGLARFRLLKLGKSNSNNIEVLSGLSGDETLVLGNLAPVHDGTPISIP